MSYKVWVLNNNSIENVFVFGKKETAFSEEDQNMMMEFDISIDDDIIIESPVQIHKDDSVMQLKKKILNEFGKESNVTYHELYLFAYTEKYIDPYAIFYETVAKNTNYINRAKCTQLLHNLLDDFEPLDATKDVYTYDDFLNMMGSSQTRNVPIGLGMLQTNDHLFSPNPFYATEFSPKGAVHTDNLLLLSHGKIVDNNIFVCLAGDVFDANAEQTEFFTKTYYPLLASKSIFDTESLLDKRRQLVFETDKMMDRRHFNSYKIVDMFYDIYENGSDEKLSYTKNGVQKFTIAINPSYTFVMPLEIIFKNLHATSKYKYMKLNLGMRRENIYRLYSNKISKTGRKIPALKPEKINSLSKHTGKQKQLSIYVEDTDLYIDIENDGVIVISWELKNKQLPSDPLKIKTIETLLIEEVNPLLENLNQFLQNSGYEIPIIKSIEDPNIEIKSMDYIASIVLNKKTKSKKIELKRDIGCLYSLFDIVSDFDENQTAQLRFKRVNNYREMDQQTLLITETFNKKGRESDVLEALMLNHNMTVDEAGARIAQYLKNAEYNAVDGNTIEIIDNPGFPVIMNIKKNKELVSKSELEFIIRDINNLGYIESLSVYFESMMRIIQDIDITGISKETIKSICKPMKKTDVVEEEIIIKPVERARAAAFDFSPTSPMAPEHEEDESPTRREETSAYKNIEELMGAEAKEDFIIDSDSSDLDLTGIDVEEGANSDDDDLDLTGIEQEGGSPSSEESVEDLYAVKNKERAKNTNPFLIELQRKDPAVILQGKDKRSNIYSRSCQSYRQPVVLTAEEKARIDRKSPGSYTKAMKYGSTPENTHYYICPRYWCFKTNTSVKDPSECDKDYLFEFKNNANPIEHEDAEGNYIHHYPGFIKKQGLKHCMPCCFASAWDTWKKDVEKNKWTNQNKTVRWDKDGNKLTRTGKGEWKKKDVSDEERVDTTGTIWNRDKKTGLWVINPDEKERPHNAEKCEDVKDDSDREMEESLIENTPMVGKTPILNPDTKRVPSGKIAFLQYAVQHFLNVDYTGKYTTINNANQLNDDVKIFVRYGVGQGTKNGLLECIGDLLGIPSGQIGKYLADAVTVDQFVKYGNASFTSVFRPPAIEIDDTMTILDENDEIWTKDATGKWKNPKSSFPYKIVSMKINPEDYANTELYKTMKSLSEDAADSFWESFAAYEIYKLYLMNPESVVDYTYVWDLISIPNPQLFKQGLNMVIMELPRKDITDSIDLICPTNTYSKTKFDIDKPTAFFVESNPNQDDKIQFEPIYLFDETTKKFTRTFTKSASFIKPILKMLNRTLNNYCRPKQSMPDVYEYKQPIMLHDLISKLQELKYKIVCQVLNFQGKTIALQVQNPKSGKQVCVPCNPSAPLDGVIKDPSLPSGVLKDPKDPSLPSGVLKKYMDNEELWRDYETTRNELDSLYVASGQKIPCNPMLKMIEDRAMIIGILTWTNQLVPINPPVENNPGDGLKTIQSDRHGAYADIALTKTNTQMDGNAKRLEIVSNAMLENQMYSLFRSTIKSLLAKPENHKHRDYLMIETRTVRPRKESIQNIIKRLRSLTRNIMVFEDYDEETRANLGKLNNKFYTCKKVGKQSSLLSEVHKGVKSALFADGCKLILPLNNLLVPTRDNRLLYYYRIADELLRFRQYSSFILNSKQILNTGNTEYKVNKDEFIVLESSLTSNYYENQKEFALNKYMSGEIPYELATAEKQITEPNTISLDAQNENGTEINLLHNCIEETADLVGDPNVIFWIKDVFKVKKGNKYEIRFKPTPECSFGPVLKILNEIGGETINDIDDVRGELWNSYKSVLDASTDREKTLDKIVKIMRERQGKSAMMASVDSVERLETVVRSSDYFMTTLDLYVMAQKMGLPIILFVNNNKENTVNSLDDLGFENGNWLILGKQSDKSAENKFYFVRAQKKTNIKTPVAIPSHSIVYKSFALVELNAMKERIQSAFQKGDWSNNMMSIEEYLQTL